MRSAAFILAVLISATLAAAQATTQPAAERVPHAAPQAGEVREFTIKELGNFPYDDTVGGGIPEDVKRLSGATVRLVGFMLPLDQAEHITTFALVPSLLDCCFGQPPQIQHMITVRTPPGRGLKYYPEEIICEGVLKVEEKRDGDWIVGLFELSVTSVKPAAK
jgi:hypothetical protein